MVDNIDLLRRAFKIVKQERPFQVDAIVVLPDHLHCIWTIPAGDADYATRWKNIKARFSRTFPGNGHRSRSRLIKGERGIWQRRYWEHTLRDQADFIRHVEYIHFNPVKHGHAKNVVDWPYSSFHRYVRMGAYSADWAGCSGVDTGGFGE